MHIAHGGCQLFGGEGALQLFSGVGSQRNYKVGVMNALLLALNGLRNRLQALASTGRRNRFHASLFDQVEHFRSIRLAGLMLSLVSILPLRPGNVLIGSYLALVLVLVRVAHTDLDYL